MKIKLISAIFLLSMAASHAFAQYQTSSGDLYMQNSAVNTMVVESAGIVSPENSLQVGEKVTTCNATYEGYLHFNTTSKKLELCDGSSWSEINVGSVSAGYVAPPSYNYLVLTETKWNGNLGGLSGADAKCLTELQTFDWMGKSNVTLSASNVKAMLCDGSTCNNLAASTTYNFAVANAVSTGGHTVSTNGSGQLVDSGSLWDTATTFNTVNPWWSNRGNVDATTWGSSPNSATNNCSNWTSTGGTAGGKGKPNNTDALRWNNGTRACTNTSRLLCAVTE